MRNEQVSLKYIAATIPTVLVWSAVALFLSKWTGHLLRGTMAFGSGAGFLVALWCVGWVALAAVGICVWRTWHGNLQSRWQLLAFTGGFLYLLLVLGD